MATKAKAFKPAVKKISKRNLTLDRLKLLTAYLTTQDEAKLDKLCENEKEAEKLKTRLFNYFLTIPRFTYYINTYLNGKYDFNKGNIRDWFYTFGEIIRLSGIGNIKSYLNFYKAKQSDRDWFFRLMRSYCVEIGEPEPSSAEINAFFTLYQNHMISESDINRMKIIVDGKGSDDETTESCPPPSVFDKISNATTDVGDITTRSIKSLSPEVQSFCENASAYIKNRKLCKQCPLAFKTPVIVDTNRITPGDVDIAFIGLNPGNQEAERLLPFVGDSGQVLRPFINELAKEFNLTWMITNALLCSTANESDIKNVRQALKCCSDVTKIVHEQFPSKIKVLLGDKAMKAHGVEGSVTKLSGQVINGHFILCHPSWVLRNKPKNLPKYQEWFAELKKILREHADMQTCQSNTTPQNIETVQIPQDRIVTRFDKNMTLFDVSVIGETIIFIMKDENGVKKYMYQTVSHPIFIKDGLYKTCNLIESEVQNTCNLTAADKKKLQQLLYQNMRHLTKG